MSATLYTNVTLSLLLGCFSGAAAQTTFTQNFNNVNCNRANLSPPNACWQFVGFDLSTTSGTVDGTCTARSSALTNPTGTYVLGTPGLRFAGPSQISFQARNTNTTTPGAAFSVVAERVSDQQRTVLQTIGPPIPSTTTSYNVPFNLAPGAYRIIFIGQGGTSGNARLLIDNIAITNILSQATPPNCNDPLPVTLARFEASQAAEGCAVAIRWATSQEQHNAQFALERSADALGFTTLFTVPGRGTTQQAQTYSFVDERPLPVGYYRLRQTDANGTYGYSKLLAVTDRCATTLVAFQYDPAQHRLDVLVGSNVVGHPLEVRLHNVVGRLLTRTTVPAGRAKQPVDVGGLAEDVVIARVLDANGRVLRTQKLYLPR